MLVIVIDYRSRMLMVLASHETSNLLNQSPAVNAFEYPSIDSTVMLSGAKHLWSIAADGVVPEISPRFFASLRMTL
jgi:hypothetical protein